MFSINQIKSKAELLEVRDNLKVWADKEFGAKGMSENVFNAKFARLFQLKDFNTLLGELEKSFAETPSLSLKVDEATLSQIASSHFAYTANKGTGAITWVSKFGEPNQLKTTLPNEERFIGFGGLEQYTLIDCQYWKEHTVDNEIFKVDYELRNQGSDTPYEKVAIYVLANDVDDAMGAASETLGNYATHKETDDIVFIDIEMVPRIESDYASTETNDIDFKKGAHAIATFTKKGSDMSIDIDYSPYLKSLKEYDSLDYLAKQLLSQSQPDLIGLMMTVVLNPKFVKDTDFYGNREFANYIKPYTQDIKAFREAHDQTISLDSLILWLAHNDYGTFISSLKQGTLEHGKATSGFSLELECAEGGVSRTEYRLGTFELELYNNTIGHTARATVKCNTGQTLELDGDDWRTIDSNDCLSEFILAVCEYGVDADSLLEALED